MRLLTSATTAVIEPSSANTPATFSGDLSATVTNNETDDVTGTVVVTDDDANENMTEVQTDLGTTFGTFSICGNR